MKYLNHRRISLALCLSMLSGVLAACGAQESTTDTDTTAAIESTSAQETAPASPLYELETRDFKGREFRISVNSNYSSEMWVEGENGDVCNDAVYARNAKIEEYFNVKIKPIIAAGTGNDAQVTEITKTLMAGEDVYDLTAVYTYLAGGPALDGYYYSWSDIPNVDFSREWWVQSANEAFSIGGKQYVAVGDLSITTLLLSYAVFFNRRVAEENGFPDLYETVLEGSWTIDKLNSLSKDLYKDINNDSKLDEGDFYGFAGDALTNLDAYPAAFDIPITNKDSDGNPTLCLNVERMHTAAEKVYSLYYDNNSFITSDGKGAELAVFTNGNAAFLTTWMDHCYSTFREMKDDYGILPYPKLDEAQESYYSNSMDNYSLLSVPKTVSDTDFVGLITEAMTRENHFSVVPAYYDVALTAKYARDEQSIAMLDIIMDGRQYDFSILHLGKVKYIGHLFRKLIAERNTNVASRMAEIEPAVKAGLEELAESYKSLGK